MDKINQFASNVKQKTSSLAKSVSRLLVKQRVAEQKEALLKKNRGRPIEEVIREIENNIPINCINELNDESSQGSHNSHSSFVEIETEDVIQKMASEKEDEHIRYEQGYATHNMPTEGDVMRQADNHGMFGVTLSDLKPKAKNS